MQEEITLRDLIEILLKRKKIIAITVLIFLLFALVYSFIIDKPEYQTQVQFKITEKFKPSTTGYESADKIIDYLAQYPEVNAAEYVLLFKSEDIMQDVIEKLNLNDRFTASELAAAIQFNTENQPIVMTMTFKEQDDCVSITNQVAKEFVNFVCKNIYTLAVQKFEEFIEYENITKDSLQNSIDSVKKQLEIYAQRDNKADLYIDSQNFTNIELNSVSNMLESKLANLNIKMDETNFVIKVIQNEIDHLKKVLVQIDSRDIPEGENTGITIAKQADSVKQVGISNKKMNIILSVILGLFIGMFAAFFAEYWQRTGQNKQSK